MMFTVDEIMDDFRRNGRECDFCPVQDTTDRSWMYAPSSPTWSSWPPVPENPTYHEKGSAFNVTSAQMKLARAFSTFSVSEVPTAACNPPNQQRPHYCQHREGKTDRCRTSHGLPTEMLTPEQTHVLNYLRGNSLIQNDFVNFIHEKAQQLSQEYRSGLQGQFRQEEPCRFNSCDPIWDNHIGGDPWTNVQSQRSGFNPRNKSRTNNWERYESGSISGRSSPIHRDYRFDNRPCQPFPRFPNRDLIHEIRRHAEMKNTCKEPPSFTRYSSAAQSLSSSAPVTPEPLSTPEGILNQDLPTEHVPKAALNGQTLGRKSELSQSAPTTPSTNNKNVILREGGASTPPSPTSTLDSTSPKDGNRPKSHNRRRRYSSESNSTKECAFCKKNGELASVYRNHIAKDAEGRTVCRILQKYVCPLCGATGEKAHTMKYCPKNLNPLPASCERRSSGSNRTCNNSGRNQQKRTVAAN